MAVKLNDIVPWGRNLKEYRLMFELTDSDMSKKIAGFGDGPAGFNCEATKLGFSVTSFDPIYQFSKEELEKQIEITRIQIMQQMRENMDCYIWTNIKNLKELEDIRMSAMRLFLSDYEKGKAENRYIYHMLPDRLPYEDNCFDIGLCSHFLFLFSDLGYDFHIKAITEMLRVCREIRIFPIVNLSSDKTDTIIGAIDYFEQRYDVEIKKTRYEFQKDANSMLIIRK